MERPAGAEIRDHMMGRKDEFKTALDRLLSANTDSAVELMDRRCGVRAPNLLQRSVRPELMTLLNDRPTLADRRSSSAAASASLVS